MKEFIRKVSNKKIILLAWTLLIVVYLLLRVNSLNIPLTRDEGMFGYAGQEILRNGLPYRDVVDIKPPIVFYINALALLFFPPTPIGMRTFLLLYNFLTLITLYFTGRRLVDSKLAGYFVAISYAVMSSVPVFLGFSASTEMFLLLPLSLSMFFMIKGIQIDRRSLIFLSGIFGALAFWTRITSAALVLFISLCFLVFQVSKKDRKLSLSVCLKKLFFWSAGFLMISFAISAYFLFKGVFGDFVYWSFTHSYLYSRLAENKLSISTIRETFLPIVAVSSPALITGLIGFLVKPSEKRRITFFTVGFLIFSIASTIPGYKYRHYFAQLLPALSIFGGVGIYFISKRFKRIGQVAWVLVYIVLTIAVPVKLYAEYYYKDTPDLISRKLFGVNPFPESIEVAKYIEEKTKKDDNILVFSSEPQILLYSNRKNVSAFAIIYPLMSDFPRHKEFQKQVWDEVVAKDPKYIIKTNIPHSYAYDERADLWLIRKMDTLLIEKYYLDAMATIGYPKGRLLTKDEFSTCRDEVNASKYKIFILRRKD